MRPQEIKIPNKINAEEQKRVLTTALLRAAQRLHLSRQELSAIIGPSEASLSRLFSKAALLDPASKEGQLAILLIRLYKNLDVLFGGNSAQCELWLRSDNEHLDQHPIKLIQSIEGLILVIQYLEAMRGKS